MPEGARTLPARYYTDPALFKAELDGLFGTMWFYAGRSEEARAPGQYFVRELNGHNIVVTRNADGRGPRVPQRLPPSRHAHLRPRRPGSSPAASSARITRGPTISTDA